MAKVTIAYGIVLILLGLGGYFGTGAMYPGKEISRTALIPSYFGIVTLILGLVALKPGARKHAMHGAAMVGLLAFLMPLGRIVGAVSKGTFDPSRPATIAILTMIILSLIFLILCVRSFIAARRARQIG